MFLLACYFFFCLSDGEHFLLNLISFWSANDAVVLIGLRPQLEGMITHFFLTTLEILLSSFPGYSTLTIRLLSP